MSEALPFSQACENNKEPILEVLCRHLKDAGSVLEIGGGTGQHAEYFARHIPHLKWQSTDLAGNVESLNRRIRMANLDNLPPAFDLDVADDTWSSGIAQNIFTANSLHIMPASSVRLCFDHIGKCLTPGGLLFIYGPFKYNGDFTAPSNANFDLWLKSRDPLSGIRDFETIAECAALAHLVLVEDNAMPANNQLLVWKKTGA